MDRNQFIEGTQYVPSSTEFAIIRADFEKGQKHGMSTADYCWAWRNINCGRFVVKGGEVRKVLDSDMKPVFA